LEKRADKMRDFEQRLAAKSLGTSYEAAHARLAAECVAAVGLRRQLVVQGKVKPLPDAREAAADRSYVETAKKLCDGLEAVLQAYEKAESQEQRKIHALWVKAGQ